jgi:hypothetical protein
MSRGAIRASPAAAIRRAQFLRRVGLSERVQGAITAPPAADPLASLQEPLQIEMSRWLAALRRGVDGPRFVGLPRRREPADTP